MQNEGKIAFNVAYLTHLLAYYLVDSSKVFSQRTTMIKNLDLCLKGWSILNI